MSVAKAGDLGLLNEFVTDAVIGVAHLRRFDFDLDLLASRGDVGEFGFHVSGF